MNTENPDQKERSKSVQKCLRDFFDQPEESFEAILKVGLHLLDQCRPAIGKIGPPDEGRDSSISPSCNVVTLSNVNEKGEMEIMCGTNEYMAVVAAITLLGRSSVGAQVGVSINPIEGAVEVTSYPLLVNGSEKVGGSFVWPSEPNEEPTIIF